LGCQIFLTPELNDLSVTLAPAEWMKINSKLNS
jgi:hypothetical protein